MARAKVGNQILDGPDRGRDVTPRHAPVIAVTSPPISYGTFRAAWMEL